MMYLIFFCSRLITILFLLFSIVNSIRTSRIRLLSPHMSGAYLLSDIMITGFFERIAENNEVTNLELGTNFLPFLIGEVEYGYVTTEFASILNSYAEVFRVETAASKSVLKLTHTLETATCSERTAAVASVTASLRDKNVIKGWRDELLPVVTSFSGPPALLIERAAYSFFGMKGYGVHINGYIKDTKGNISKLWVARRSKTKSTWPGMLDHIVAGGLAHGYSPYETVVKECGEEASIPEATARLAKPVGAVSYRSKDQAGQMKRDVLFCFDLELPPEFIPTPMDGEVESFECHDLQWVVDKVAQGGADGYKPNCNLVLIDFFVRHGVIKPEAPGYLKLVSSLRTPECS